MKKSIILLAVILMTLSASAQMYIWKNGEIIDEYNILDVDSVCFRPFVCWFYLADTVKQ